MGFFAVFENSFACNPDPRKIDNRGGFAYMQAKSATLANVSTGKAHG
tara:strand:- start:488 stop:628 length:141 start_codon:yes stop_codon:yes gene_type:complete